MIKQPIIIVNSAVFAFISSLVVTARLVTSAPNFCINNSTNFIELTAQNGYASDEHVVITDDGYILSIFRIYQGKKYQESVKVTPVLLVHGLTQDSLSWVDSGPDAGLAYLLSDAGYDTWVGNTRGNAFAMKHVYLNPYVDAKYWEFSADEIGYYDIPAMIDYILNITRTPKLNYIGFSQGGGSALITFSERPEYCKKVGVLIALASPTKETYMTSLLKVIIRRSSQFEMVLNKIGVYNTFLNKSLIQQIDQRSCSYYMKQNPFCKFIIDALDTPHPGSITKSSFGNICSHFPAPIAIRTLARYGQVSISGRFQKYDHGKEENLKKYGSSQPPEYNLTSVCVPVMIGQGLSDTLVDVKDSEWLASQLVNLEEFFIVDDPQWNHFDMTYSRYTKQRLFPKINQYLLKYTNLN